MSSLCRTAAFAVALHFVVPWAASDELSAEVMSLEDACAADDEECSLSLRQLRGEQKLAVAEEHGFIPSPEIGRKKIVGMPAAKPSEAGTEPAGRKEIVGKPAAKPSEADAEPAKATEEDDEEPAEAEPAAPTKDSAEAEAEAEPVAPAKGSAKGKDDKASTEETKKDDDYDDDEDDFDDDEETVYGEFCCQFGQGKGAFNLQDVGASCYPSAKPEMNEFCDDKSVCTSDCNGTWVTGFCAYNATGGSDTPCATELNTNGTGYDYTGSPKRDVMNATCAASESACGNCNGTWCHYVKTPMY